MIVPQRRAGDCGIAALAMWAEVAYEDAYVAVIAVDRKHRGKRGLYNRELVAAAKRFGFTLEPTRKFDLDEHEGILTLQWGRRKGKKDQGGHFVVVRDGRIVCPLNGIEKEWREYLAQHKCRAATLLKEADR